MAASLLWPDPPRICFALWGAKRNSVDTQVWPGEQALRWGARRDRESKLTHRRVPSRACSLTPLVGWAATTACSLLASALSFGAPVLSADSRPWRLLARRRPRRRAGWWSSRSAAHPVQDSYSMSTPVATPGGATRRAVLQVRRQMAPRRYLARISHESRMNLGYLACCFAEAEQREQECTDRKSTRLNSSHR